ncbi:hypothetical protein [Chitinophaga pinensis]|uniref:Uncharacterized protein n=1 Tax=Chitinophaga pinensis (strain ATCC 43595 / DSM 2588 / LMG 13176 / NBRC 15968 / NCIMB 11800 / UQM 2034) TaxID=485918 RepID=A0A979G9R0_CHIPD|nr:hypothetical protein [Chitinophaga pinensis]ACU63310.1 hypothetical protein Cpin_5892 [Chitinophaga pinensis DSM 2588]
MYTAKLLFFKKLKVEGYCLATAIFLLTIFPTALLFAQLRPVKVHLGEAPKQGEEKPLAFDDRAKQEMRFAVYTDFEGFQQSNPNGLIQTEFYFSWPGINKPIIRIPKKGKETVHIYLLRNMVIPNIQLNKLEDKLKYLPLIKANSHYYVSTFDLIQYANLTNYVKLNLITFGFKSKTRLYADLMLNHVNTLAIDSATNNKFSLNSLGPGISFKYKTEDSNSPINLMTEVSLFGLHLLNTEFRQHDGPQYSSVQKDITELDTIVRKHNTMWRFQAEVTIDPSKIGKEKPSSQSSSLIFLRTYIYTERVPFNKNLKGSNNSLFMLQLGYRLTLNDVLTKKNAAAGAANSAAKN